MKTLIDALEIDYSLLDLEIDESKIEDLLALLPQETRATLTFEEQIEIVKKILNSDVKDLFEDVIHFVSNAE